MKKVEDYEYNYESNNNGNKGISQQRGTEIISKIEAKIKNNSIPHFEIIRIVENNKATKKLSNDEKEIIQDSEYDFIYQYLEAKEVKIRGINITMEEIEGYERVAKRGANYNDLPEVIEPEKQRELFEQLEQIKKDRIERGIDYKKDEEYKEVRKQIADGNLRLAAYISYHKSFENLRINQDDLLGYGCMGLINAIDNYNPDKGAKFSTYAFLAIHRRIERGICKELGINGIRFLEYKRIKEVQQEFLEKEDKEATLEDISAILELPTEKIKTLLRFGEMIINPDSIEEVVYDTDVEKIIDEHHDSGKVETFYTGEDYEYYEDGVAIEVDHEDDVTDFENDIQQNAHLRFMKKKINEVLETLTPREAEVLRLRFGLKDGKPKTLEEVGKEFNVTRERLRQIEAKALRKLRHPSRSKQLIDF